MLLDNYELSQDKRVFALTPRSTINLVALIGKKAIGKQRQKLGPTCLRSMIDRLRSIIKSCQI